MLFRHRYEAASGLIDTGSESRVSLASDSRRPEAFLVGELTDPVRFREAISALHAVVTADLRPRQRDHTHYLAWLEQRRERARAEIVGGSAERRQRIAALSDQVAALDAERRAVYAPYWQARARYYDHLFRTNRLLWILLDPVITVQPDRVLFEAFSLDESSYGCVSCAPDLFGVSGETAWGTTNIDYSSALYTAFQRLRSYKTTRLGIGPAGLAVHTSGSALAHEKKIEVPDSWVRGFLQVSAAMTLPQTRVELTPVDLYNLLGVLARRRERSGPRSLRFRLLPDAPPELVVEPWGERLVFPRARHDAVQPTEIRLWGRRRLLVLKRLVPLASRFTLVLAGSGLPAFVLADLGPMVFTLGLSGWTAADWSHHGQFDLMAPRAALDGATALRVLDGLEHALAIRSADLAAALALDPAVAAAGLVAAVQAGRAVYDLADGLWRWRPLSADPLPLEALRFASPREAEAERLVEAGLVEPVTVSEDPRGRRLAAGVLDNAVRHRPEIVIDRDERLVQGRCDCHWFTHHRMTQGPCRHMLALRMAERRQGGVPA